MPRDTKRPTMRIPAKPIDPIVLDRGELLTARSVLMRHRDLILAAAKDMAATDLKRLEGPKLGRAAMNDVDWVRAALEHIIDGWRPGAGGGG